MEGCEKKKSPYRRGAQNLRKNGSTLNIFEEMEGFSTETNPGTSAAKVTGRKENKKT